VNTTAQSAIVRRLAEKHGFICAGIGPARPSGEDRRRYLDWCEKGFAADMGYLVRDPSSRTDPKMFFPEARSVVSLVAPYPIADCTEEDPSSGRVARYAWGRDYHVVIEDRLKRLAGDLKKEIFPEIKICFAVDSKPLLERSLAARAGCGWIGKNTSLIVPRRGSFVFLAEMLTDLPLDERSAASGGACGSCRRCIDHCPTGALVAPYVLDSRKCIAYHTIENKGMIPREIRSLIEDRLFGCDACQDVCPHNRHPDGSPWPEFSPSSGTGPWLDLVEILGLRSDEEFKTKFGGSPLRRSKRTGLVRNACVVAANKKVPRTIPLLKECLSKDVSPVIRGHAAWALGVLGEGEALREARLTEKDPLVLDEIDVAVAGGR